MQTFPGHFLKKYEKYLKKEGIEDAEGAPSLKTKPKPPPFDDRYVDNKNTVLDDKDAIQLTFERVVPHKQNWKKKQRAKATEQPPRGLTALASFPVSCVQFSIGFSRFTEDRIVP